MPTASVLRPAIVCQAEEHVLKEMLAIELARLRGGSEDFNATVATSGQSESSNSEPISADESLIDAEDRGAGTHQLYQLEQQAPHAYADRERRRSDNACQSSGPKQKNMLI
eukprot:250757-Chlamydomonas_euryale.AAC.13